MNDSRDTQTDENAINPALLVGLNANELVPTPAWSAKDIKFLIENRRYMSASTLAGRMNRSKGSVMGKLHRLGLKTTKDFNRMMLAIGTKRAHAEGKYADRNLVNSKKDYDGWTSIATVYQKGEKAVPQHMMEPPVGILDGVGVKMWELEHHHCKWVVGEPSDLTCCGQNRHPNSPYCQEHHKIAYKGKPHG